jgi:SNF2 family DNA or RNA helicase
MVIDLYDEENLKFVFEYSDSISALAQQLPSRTYLRKEKVWIFPVLDLFILKKILKENGLEAVMTEPARQKYVSVINEYKKTKELAENKDLEYQIIGLKPDVKLYPFQKVGSKFLDVIGNGLLGMDMGLGKTITSISHASQNIRKSPKDLRILVVAPASLKYEWAIQLARFTDYSYTIIPSGPDRLAKYGRQTNFTIMNYDLVYRDIEELKKTAWDIVICDEIQRIKNYKTETFKAMEQLNCAHRVGLTGTPIENDVMDLFTIMKFINPKIFGVDETTFKYRYCQVNQYKQIVPGKFRNLDELNKKLSFVMFRRKKRDVLDDLPERVTNHFYIELTKEERDKYEEIKSGILEDMETGKIKKIHAMAQMTYLREVCDALNLVIERQKITSSKFDELKNIIKGFPPEEKIVIFTQYKRMGDIIAQNIGLKSVHLHGQVKNDCKYEREIERDVLKKNKNLEQRKLDILLDDEKKKAVCINCPYYKDDKLCDTRKKLMAKFNDEEEQVKLFLSTDAGKAGLNLQKAGVIINYDLSFNPATNEQRISRIERIGQEREKIFVLNLICRDTVEERVLAANTRKQKLFDRVIDGLAEDQVERLVLNHKNIKDLL